MEFTKLAAFNNFPHMFLRPQNYAQNIFERDLDLVHKFDGQVTGRDQHMNQEKIEKKHSKKTSELGKHTICGR